GVAIFPGTRGFSAQNARCKHTRLKGDGTSRYAARIYCHARYRPRYRPRLIFPTIVLYTTYQFRIAGDGLGNTAVNCGRASRFIVVALAVMCRRAGKKNALLLCVFGRGLGIVKTVILPSPDSLQVWFDFDGTISRQDVLDELVNRFSRNESWKLIEERWKAGLIGSEQCLRQEFSLLKISNQELDSFIDQIEIDPGFIPLVELLRQNHVPFAILSDGIETFIRRILQRHNIRNIEIRANRLARRQGQMRLVCPHRQDHCLSGAAHCKCASANALRIAPRKTVYIGDGRSDLCPARQADIVFAKGVLAQELTAQQRPFIAYAGLYEITATMNRAWTARVAAV
ncbi:MAG: MtnX-like HAD-IB family phosphatase, partial [Phycisphaerae bacterium]